MDNSPKNTPDTSYSEKVAQLYAENPKAFNETDRDLFPAFESVGGLEGKTVLDLGCGNGGHSFLMHDLGAAKVVGVDVTEKFVEIAKQKAQQNSVPDVQFFVADASQRLPFNDASFSLVFSNFVMHYFEDEKKVFQEFSRILASDGSIIATWNVTEVDPEYEHLYNTFMPIRLGQGENSFVVQNRIKSESGYKEAITEAGFEIISETELYHPNATVDASFPNKDHIHKKAMLFVLKKVR